MWRILVVAGMVFFGVGAVGGVLALGFSVAEQRWQEAGGLALGTAVLAWISWACWRDWQREQQARRERA